MGARVGAALGLGDGIEVGAASVGTGVFIRFTASVGVVGSAVVGIGFGVAVAVGREVDVRVTVGDGPGEGVSGENIGVVAVGWGS